MSKSPAPLSPAEPRWRALLALLLIAPAPSVGVIMAVHEGPIGTAIWMAAKVWLLALPVVWHVAVDRRSVSFSPPRSGGFGLAIALGVAMSMIIVAAYLLVGRVLLVPAEIRAALKPPQLAQPGWFLLGAIYWITINAALEEYVYRWFIFRKAEVVTNGPIAVLIAAAIFVAHHALALSHYTSPAVTAMASTGIFVGAAVWSALYLKYRSVWVPYVSHAIVDIAVFSVAGYVIFQG